MTWSVRTLCSVLVVAAATAVPVGMVRAQEGPPADLSRPLTLDEAIRIGLDRHNTLAIAESSVVVSRARLTQARSSYFPQVTPVFDYQNNLSRVRVGGSTAVDRSEGTTTLVGLRQLLFDTGKREQTVAAARKGIDAAALNVADTRQTVVLNVTNAFYELKRQLALVRVSEASRDRTRTTLEATEAFAEAGTTRRIDVLQARADMANADVQLIQARNNVRLAETSLKNAMGVTTPERVAVDETEPAAPPAAADARPLQEYVQEALAQRPDFARERILLEADRHSVRIAEIEAGVQVQADLTESLRIDPNPGEVRAIGATVSYPLFDAGSARAAVRAARESVRQNQEALELTRRGIQTEVEQAYLLKEEARLRSSAADSALEASKVNYEAARQAQAEGAGDILSVITAQTQLVTAETNAVEALYDYHTALARLQRAIGANDTYQVAKGSSR